MVVLRKAKITDIAGIQSIAQNTWHSTYSTILSVEQIKYMLDKMYDSTQLSIEINDNDYHFTVAEENGNMLGFCSAQVKHSEQRIKLHKIYILPNAQGKGIGKKLIDCVIQFAKSKNKKGIELNANKQNPAINFYINQGFKIASEMILDIGQGYVMDDYVMVIEW